MSQQSTTPLIPRKLFFGNPDKAMPRISPDGARIAYLAPVEDVLNVWVGPSDDLSSAKPVTNDKIRGIRMYFWAHTNDHILYIQDRGGDENWHVYSVNLSSGETIDLTPIDGVHAQIQDVSQRFPNEIIIGLNDREANLHDLYRVNIETGEKALLIENEGFAGYLTDDDYNVRFASRLTPDGGSETLKRTGEDSWEPFMTVGMDDVMTTSPMGFDKSGKVLHLLDSRGRDTGAMTEIDLDTGVQTIIAENSKADASSVMIHPIDHHIQAVSFTYERKEWQIIDDSIASDLEYLRTVSRGDVEIVSRTLDDNLWIVAYMLDNSPVRYYKYDREAHQADFMFSNRQELEGLTLARMNSAVIKSRDGLNLVNYCTLPASSSTDGVKPDMPLPTVLLVHGGPWGRDNWGYDSIHQLLANRGYAVISVNFRGSTGFGKSFINAANKEWGGKMHDDLIDTVKWAIDEGIADPQRVAIMGGSYGGYATLAGLTFTPDTFACGVDIVGPSNLITLIESFPPYWEPEMDMIRTRVGDPRTDEGKAFLKTRSPLTYVDRIERPLLIGQGANDPRVKQAESDQIVTAMQEKEIPVTYLLYPDEGHGFARPENTLSFFAAAEAFLAQHIGGRFEPIGDGFEGSSITVPTGAHYVPGLAGC